MMTQQDLLWKLQSSKQTKFQYCKGVRKYGMNVQMLLMLIPH